MSVLTDVRTAAEVVVAGTGAVYRAPLGTALPTTADAALNVAFVGHGYITQDGVAESIDEQTTDIIAWQNSDLVRKIMTSQDLTYAFAGLETNGTMLETYYGNYSLAAGTGTVTVSGAQGIRASWVLDFLDGFNKHVRVVLPDAQVTQRGGVTRNSQGAFEYPVTLTAYPNAAGYKAYIYHDDSVTFSA